MRIKLLIIFFKKLSLALFFLLCVNLGYAKLEIMVKPSPDWGPISDADVKTLCQNITDHFEKHLRPENEIHDSVNVSRTFVGYNFATLDPDPDVKYKIGMALIKDMEIRVDDFYYFILPFAHEFCHILHNFEVTTIENPNLWFQEGIATMGGIWALRSMAKTWKTDSPFGTFVAQDGGVAYFSDNFNHYADAYLKVFPDFQYDGTGEEWLKEYETLAREDSYHHSTQFKTNPAQLTFKFLPIFEENPEAWNAVRKMPATKKKMSEYMQDWYDAVDAQDREYVEAIAKEMGITVTLPIMAYNNINTDVNTDNDTGARSDTVSLLPISVPSPNIGQQLELSLKITNGETVAGYQATVQFDDTALRYVESSLSDYLPDGAFFVPPISEGNLVKLNAASVAGESNGDGTLATLTFEVITVKASTLTLSDVLLSNSTGETFTPQVENAQITEPTKLTSDVNGDGTVNIADLVLVASNLGQTGSNAADVNSDGVVNIADLVLVAGALGTSAAPSIHPQALEMFTAIDVKQWVSTAQQLNPTDMNSQRGILFLQQLLVALTPKETALLPNFPNPFNPETWIPYHLAKGADVTLHIYAINGALVRTLTLGHQAAGKYQNRSRAAYWDGKNAFGEPVASGLYFYTLTAGDFTATRKMLIQK